MLAELDGQDDNQTNNDGGGIAALTRNRTA
jgi:hypothetical protein